MARLKDDNVILKASLPSKDAKVKATVNTVQSATTERKGIIRIATEQETIEGVDNTTAITPYTLKVCTDTFEYEQAIASDTWVINHNLNKKPSITIVDSADSVVEGAEKYIDENTVEIRFNGAFKGKAYLN